MKRILVLASILIAYPTFAQAQPIRVKVIAGNSQQVSQTIADMLAGRIGASSRYALVTKSVNDILLSVECMPNVINEKQVGIACDTELVYWPLENIGLSTDLVGSMAVGPEPYVAENLFDAFVEETTGEKMTAAAQRFKVLVNQAIAVYPQGVK